MTDAPSDSTHTPLIILVRPQMGENIGAAARAMANFGLADMRIVAPRDGWPNPAATTMASGANHVINGVRVFDTLEEAAGDLGRLYATTARPRGFAKPVYEPGEAASRLRSEEGGPRPALVFGPERSGLENRELGLCDAVVTFPTEASFPSLNLAQAVLLMAYVWRTGEAGPEGEALHELAPKETLYRLFEHLEGALDARGFFKTEEKKPRMVLNLRAVLHRAQLSHQEVETLRGVIAALTEREPR
jgi:tRNA/rRNA methyltransferase